MDLLQIATPITAVSVVGVVVLVVLMLTARPDRTLAVPVVAARHHAWLTSALALVSGLAAAGLVVRAEIIVPGVGWIPGLGETLAPLAFGIVHTIAIAVGELTWPRPRGAQRRARLDPRSIATTAPRWLTRLGVMATALAFCLILGGAVLSGTDGRTIRFGYNHASGKVFGQVTGTFPGYAFGAPALVAACVLVALTLGVLRIVVRRPAVADADDATERALRRASAHRALRGATAAVLALDAGFLFFGGSAVATAFPRTIAHDVGIGVAIIGVVAGMAALLLLCVPAPRLPREPHDPDRVGLVATLKSSATV